MSDREALLRAVCENPDDDTPRLVLADWLEENGEPERAEFIRIQCQLLGAHARRIGSAEERPISLHRSQAILEANRDRWLAELPTPGKAGDVRWGNFFHRGFVCQVAVASLDAVVHHAEVIFAAAPVSHLFIRSARVRVGRTAIEELVGILGYRRLRFVSLGVLDHDMAEFESEVAALDQSRLCERMSVQFIGRGVSPQTAEERLRRVASTASRHGRRVEYREASNL